MLSHQYCMAYGYTLQATLDSPADSNSGDLDDVLKQRPKEMVRMDSRVYVRGLVQLRFRRRGRLRVWVRVWDVPLVLSRVNIIILPRGTIQYQHVRVDHMTMDRKLAESVRVRAAP